MRDFANSIELRRSISPAAAVSDNTPFVGQIVDHAGFRLAVYAINIGALAAAAATFTVLLEHGDAANLSDAAAVPDSQLTGTEAGASFIFSDDNKVRKLGYVGTKRYSRLTITPAANTGSSFVTAICILGNSRYPVPAQSA